ncbi:MAG: hypothetical protein B6A08_19830 [Sorangiineae bacterium NIC37A_2]|nr:MAG: hypothetical protein B6A08_19830 [Sorangiineae bacterium NIC37A_2]
MIRSSRSSRSGLKRLLERLSAEFRSRERPRDVPGEFSRQKNGRETDLGPRFSERNAWETASREVFGVKLHGNAPAESRTLPKLRGAHLTFWAGSGPLLGLSRGQRPGATIPSMSAAEQLIEAALKLNHEDRAKLVEAVAASLEGEGLGEEWEQTIARRIAELEDGSVLPVAGEEVFRKLGQRFGDK